MTQAAVTTDLPDSSAAIRASFERAARVRAFWNAHYDEFLAKYPEMYVVVQDGKVIMTNPDLISLFYALRDIGLHPSQVDIKFFSEYDRFMIL
jgi:hypothetical protein